mmetsp:Transcript_9614/g.29998  ORF Transcript_9614/g.29998 Transcript_9614/m.29998 type:complete len:221 (-) Transcript_9614:2145-2807(-)
MLLEQGLQFLVSRADVLIRGRLILNECLQLVLSINKCLLRQRELVLGASSRGLLLAKPDLQVEELEVPLVRVQQRPHPPLAPRRVGLRGPPLLLPLRGRRDRLLPGVQEEGGHVARKPRLGGGQRLRSACLGRLRTLQHLAARGRRLRGQPQRLGPGRVRLERFLEARGGGPGLRTRHGQCTLRPRALRHHPQGRRRRLRRGWGLRRRRRASPHRRRRCG